MAIIRSCWSIGIRAAGAQSQASTGEKFILWLTVFVCVVQMAPWCESQPRFKALKLQPFRPRRNSRPPHLRSCPNSFQTDVMEPWASRNECEAAIRSVVHPLVFDRRRDRPAVPVITNKQFGQTHLRKAFVISLFMKVSRSRKINWHCPPLIQVESKTRDKNREAI